MWVCFFLQIVGAFGLQGWRERKWRTGLDGCGYGGDSLQERTSVNQLNFLPEDRGYIGLGSLGTSPNLHKVVCMLLSHDFVCDSRVLWPSSEYRS